LLFNSFEGPNLIVNLPDDHLPLVETLEVGSLNFLLLFDFYSFLIDQKLFFVILDYISFLVLMSDVLLNCLDTFLVAILLTLNSNLFLFLILFYDDLVVSISAHNTLLTMRDISDTQALFINLAIFLLSLTNFDRVLMSFSCFEQLLRLDSDLIRDFLSAGCFVGKSFDSVLEQLSLFD